jgi:hypothetical protein
MGKKGPFTKWVLDYDGKYTFFQIVGMYTNFKGVSDEVYSWAINIIDGEDEDEYEDDPWGEDEGREEDED